MYLSRLQLNAASRTVWRSVMDQPYRLHQIVMHGFPDGVRREDANVLHRLDAADRQVTLLVQSDLQPNWRGLDERLLLPADPFDPQPNPAVQSLAGLELPAGRALRFRLRANPSKRLSRGAGRKPGPRVELYREADQLDWLQRKAGQHGFRLLDFRAQVEGKQQDRHRQLTVYTVLYEGMLQITDAAAFRDALRTGIGPAKAFGCGLLSLAPA